MVILLSVAAAALGAGAAATGAATALCPWLFSFLCIYSPFKYIEHFLP